MHSRFVAAPPSPPSPKIPHRNRTIELERALKAYKAAQDLKAERSKLCEKAGSERFFLVVQSIFKNEADVLAEWIEHHRWQGVEHFFLVDNNSSDNFAQVLAPYAQYVTLRTEPKPHQQVRQLAQRWQEGSRRSNDKRSNPKRTKCDQQQRISECTRAHQF